MTRGAALALVALATAAAGARPPILVVVLDTVRADAVSGDVTPVLDRLAADGLRYPHAYSLANWTLPSHATLFTGLPPTRHGARSALEPLATGVVTLAEALRDAGYETVGVTENPWLAPRLGMTRGFQHWFEVQDPDLFPDRPDAPEMLAHLLRQRARDKPAFVFVNVTDAHAPYAIRPRNPWVPGDADLNEMRAAAADPGALLCDTAGHERALAILHGLYLGDVHAADAALGRVLTVMREAGLDAGLVTVVAADHGEHFGERGRMLHDVGVLEPLLHVPLVVHGLAGVAPAVIDAPVHLGDVLPTLLGLVGVPVPAGVVGRPLPVRPGPAPARAIVAEFDDPATNGALPAWVRGVRAAMTARCRAADRVTGDARAAVRWPLKLVWYHDFPAELYDLRADPDERTDLAPRWGATVTELTGELGRAGVLRFPQVERTPAAQEAPPLDPAQAARLRALGYLTGEAPAR